MYAYCISVEFLRYKVLIFCWCGLLGRNRLLILTTLPNNSNSTIQWVFQLLLKLDINDLYANCIFVKSLSYKVLIYILCVLFGGNSLLILTTFTYKFNSVIQWDFQLLLKIAITDLYAY